MMRGFAILICLFSISAHSSGDWDYPPKADYDAAGACTDYDKTHLFPENYAFAEAWGSASGYSGLDLTRFRKKYPEAVNMTDECLGCFNQMTKCSVSPCAFKCMFDRTSTECRQCSLENCGEEMQTCSGVSPAQLPDFKRD